MDPSKNSLYYACIADLIDTPEVLSMETLPQHGKVSCFSHSIYVSYFSYLLCLHLHLDAVAAARGGLLHDLFLYDWRVHGSHKGLHAFTHPRAALKNALQLCDLTPKEQDIILTHMWPVTLFSFYHFWESAVVSFVDKCCAVCEAFRVFEHLSSDVLPDFAHLCQQTPYKK